MGFSRNINGRVAKRHWAEEVAMICGLLALLLLMTVQVHLLGEGPPLQGREKTEAG